MSKGIKMEKERQRERLLKMMDKRNMVVIYGDDVPDEKRGERVAGAEPQHNGSAGKVTRSVVYVSSMIKAGKLRFYSLAKKYVPLRRFKGNTRYFRKKKEIARDLIAKDVEEIKKLGVKKRIIVCTDCGYTSEKMVVFLRRFGASYILGIKGNTIIPLKGKKEDLNEYFLKSQKKTFQ